MSAWDLIGKANATKNGTPFAPGTHGEATILALRQFTSNNGDGEVLVIEAAIEKSEAKSAKYVKDMSTGETADVVTQAVGTQVSVLYMLTKHKAAPGAAKAALLAILGLDEATLKPEEWGQAVELAKKDSGVALRGIRVKFDVHTKMTKAAKKTIHPVTFAHIEQTDAEIDAAAKKYPVS